MLLADEWKDYELIDASSGQKFERWGKVYLLRPDPMVVWDNGDLLEKLLSSSTSSSSPSILTYPPIGNSLNEY